MMFQLSCSLLDRLRKICSNKTPINHFLKNNLYKAYSSDCRNQICHIQWRAVTFETGNAIDMAEIGSCNRVFYG